VDKPASVIMQFEKTGGYWEVFVADTEKGLFREVGNTMIALVRVKAYSLVDHQFIQLKLNRKNGEEFTIQVPRSIVVTIIEGKQTPGQNSYFAGGTATRT
jgi:hypothetical protein